MLTDQELDDVYTRACYAMTELGEGKQPLFLARLALLLMKEVGDADRVRGAIATAQLLDGGG
ncbi:MAG: hypothetical protein ACM36B_19640 [Bacteroidota bacterium]|jgi:Protein of unknown function (DUF2783)